MRLVASLLVASLALVACGKSDSGTASKGDNSKSVSNATVMAAVIEKFKALDEAQIPNHVFTLKSDLDFKKGEVRKTAFSKGQPLTFAFHNQKPITREVYWEKGGCAVSIDSPVEFFSNENLSAGPLSKAAFFSGDVEFAMNLKKESLESFDLTCLNVTGIEGIKAHIGHLIDIN